MTAKNTILNALALYGMYKVQFHKTGKRLAALFIVSMSTFFPALKAQYFHHVYGKNLAQECTGMATTAITKVGHII